MNVASNSNMMNGSELTDKTIREAMGAVSSSAATENNNEADLTDMNNCCLSLSKLVLSDRLFHPHLIAKAEQQSTMDYQFTPVPDGLQLRPLCVRDYDTGFLPLLSQLTEVGVTPRSAFVAQFHRMQRSGLFYIMVVEEIATKQVVGAASLVVEPKFIHGIGQRGRIEDVVVSKSMRGKQLGKILLERLTALGRLVGVYKMSLECKDHLVGWYEKFGYKVDAGNNFMVCRFDQKPPASKI